MVSNAKYGTRYFRKFWVVLSISLLALQVLAVLCALAKPAYAYVDPGSGLLAFQMMSSTFAGLVFVLRKRIRRFIGKRRPETGTSDLKDEEVESDS